MSYRITVLAAAAAAALASSIAQAADLPSFASSTEFDAMPVAWSPWMVRGRVIGIVPDAGGKLTSNGAPLVGANVSIDRTIVPELDISYFFTRNVSAELILGVTRHSIRGEGTLAGTRIGSTWLLPPTLTLQYHFDGPGPVKPYVGAGAAYAVFFGAEERGTFNGFRLHNDLAPALQAGLDVMIDAHWGVNIDVKKLFLDTKVKLNTGAIRARVDIDPWIVGTGVSYHF